MKIKKKNEYAIEFLEKNISKFQCPICNEKLGVHLHNLQCINNHTFNISKKGTVQLVTKFLKSDYDQELFASRTNMMNAGLFNPVFDILSENLMEDDFVIDAGSGEGSALIDISKKKNIVGLGLDLSSEGVVSSTRGLSSEKLLFVVSNLANIPLVDNSVNKIINLLSPASYDEFIRVLKENGEILKIIPNGEYLKEIRQFAANKKEHIKETYDNEEVISNLKKKFSNIEVQNIKYDFELSTPELKRDMFNMTPLTWSLDSSSTDEFIKSNIHNVTVDLQLLKIKM